VCLEGTDVSEEHNRFFFSLEEAGSDSAGGVVTQKTAVFASLGKPLSGASGESRKFSEQTK
jgi:hypothetical protein